MEVIDHHQKAMPTVIKSLIYALRYHQTPLWFINTNIFYHKNKLKGHNCFILPKVKDVKFFIERPKAFNIIPIIHIGD